MLTRLKEKLHLDKSVYYGVLNKFWLFITGPITIFLIISFFSKETQGFYYSIYSLLAFRVFIELGLSNVAIQFSSHEWAYLSLSKEGEVQGGKQSIARLVTLGRYLFKWFFICSLFYMFVLYGVGFFTFYDNESLIAWKAVWAGICILSTIEILTIPAMALLQGCGQLKDVYKLQLIDTIASRFVAWVIILSGGGLWAIFGYYFCNILISIIFLFKKRRFFKVFKKDLKSNFNWKDEIFPMQWRIALSSICGYFTFSIFVPVSMKFFGAEQAGQLGLSLNLISMMFAVACIWFNVKVPEFGELISKKKYDELDSLFFSVYKVFIFIIIAGALLLSLSIFLINIYGFQFSERFLPLADFNIFLTGYFFMYISWPFSLYLRCHKKEPLLIASIIGSILIGGCTVFSGMYYNISVMACLYSAVNLLFVPIIFFIWKGLREKWHFVESS